MQDQKRKNLKKRSKQAFNKVWVLSGKGNRESKLGKKRDLNYYRVYTIHDTARAYCVNGPCVKGENGYPWIFV